MENTLTKEQAIEQMKLGKKVTHEHFSDNEWATMEYGKIVLEDGVRCSPEEFWKWRPSKSWETGWSIYTG